MRVFLYSDNTAQFWHRIYQPVLNCAPILALEGIDLHIQTTPRLDYDAYVFHTAVPKHMYPFLAMLKAHGKKIIWSIDDDLWYLPQWNPASKYIDLGHAQWFLDNANEIWVSTDELHDRVLEELIDSDAVSRRKHIKVLPNLIDPRYWKDVERPTNKQIRIVWAGSAFHEPDLDLIGQVFEKVFWHQPDVECYFFGSWPSHLSEAVRVPGSNVCQLVPSSHYHGRIGFIHPVAIEQFPTTLQGINADIGVAGLVDEKFAHSKSALKYLEYSMCQMATVASDLPPYQDTKALLGDLYERIVELIEDEELRVGLGQYAYDDVRQRWCWDGDKRTLWLNAFRSLT